MHELVDLWMRQNEVDTASVKCAICHAHTNDPHIDHCVPLKCGGEHAISNLQYLCPACHKEKTRNEVDAYTTEQAELAL